MPVICISPFNIWLLIHVGAGGETPENKGKAATVPEEDF